MTKSWRFHKYSMHQSVSSVAFSATEAGNIVPLYSLPFVGSPNPEATTGGYPLGNNVSNRIQI